MTPKDTGTMLRWAETAEAIRATPKTTEKSAIVAEYLRALDEAALPIAAVFLSGRPFPERDQRKTGLGWRAITTVVQEVAGADAGAMGRAYDRSSDVGTAVGDLLAEAGHEPDGRPLALAEVAEAYDRLATTRGRDAKAEVFARLLRRADPLSARYLTAILGGELRIGLRDGHLEKGIARAFEQDLACRAVGGHAHRRYRPHRAAGRRRCSRHGATLPLSPAQVDVGQPGRRRGGGA